MFRAISDRSTLAALADYSAPLQVVAIFGHKFQILNDTVTSGISVEAEDFGPVLNKHQGHSVKISLDTDCFFVSVDPLF
jgi:hypothetical protein